ncbi:MAG TPA: SEC-C metal-binding domain-containing protein [Elusimicrobiota bacterium]|jgi:preprotein translocase subunit SecA|nr:SEC-C metal-binding domain-containing protein [Elusimicrobiota bacterium]
MWNPLDKIKDKIAGAVAEKAAEKAAAGMDLKELEKQGMLGKFFRHWKNPAFMAQLRAISARMQAEGVNIKDSAAVKAWIEAHQKEIASGQLQAPAAAAGDHKPFVKTEPDLGRNEPCKCGSGKKFKKCCGK